MIDYSLRSIGFKTLKFETASRNSVCGHNLYMYSLQPTSLNKNTERYSLSASLGDRLYLRRKFRAAET
jgi:hypothetical protein